jgi:surface protein
MTDSRLVSRSARVLLTLASIGLLGLPALPVHAAEAVAGGRFVTTWTGPQANLCLYGAVEVTIDWGDGTTQQVTGTRVPGSAGPVSHTFNQAAPTHQVTVTGSFPRLGCSDVNDAVAGLVSVDEWGATGTTDLSNAFWGGHQLQAVAEPPGTVTDMSQMFLVSSFDQPIGGWDTTGVTDMRGMFTGSSFNQPIGGWNTSGVTDMARMFLNTPFDQPIGAWDTSQVTDMSRMFSYSAFNQPIGGWNTASVTDMTGMFEGASFNQPVGAWDTANVTDLSWMFGDTPFNRPVGSWDTSSVTTMTGLFNATPFNQPIGGWDTSSVTTMDSMFSETPFNQPVGAWDTSNVTNLAVMFRGTPFNQPIGGWDISNVTNLFGMFQNSSFNQPVGSWDTGNVRDLSYMFARSAFDQPLGAWDTAEVVNTSWMFSEAAAFDQPLGGWDTAGVVDMNGMFNDAAAFNQDLSAWCVPTILQEPVGFDSGALAWILPRPRWGTCGGLDVAGPVVEFTSVTSTDQVRARGTAADFSGIDRVLCAIQDRSTGKWLRRDRTWGAYDRLKANVQYPGATSTNWLCARILPPGSFTIKAIAFDTLNHVNPRPRPYRIVNVS